MAVYLYRNSFSEARRCNELQLWRDSHKENIRCRDDIDKMVSEQYNGNILPDEIIKTACKEFGIDRVGWVLANTVIENDYDGRYRLGRDFCLLNSDNDDYTGKLLIMRSDSLADEYILAWRSEWRSSDDARQYIF